MQSFVRIKFFMLHLLFLFLAEAHEENLKEEFLPIFEALDRDSNGLLDVTEMARGLTTLGESYKGNEVVCNIGASPPALVDCLAHFGRSILTDAEPTILFPIPATFDEILAIQKKTREEEVHFPQVEQKACPLHDLQGVPILITSDWHVEPWYLTDGHLEVDSRVARYHGTTLDNMFTCRSSKGPSECILQGNRDPPIELWQTHYQSYAKVVANYTNLYPGLFWYLGDSQSHVYMSNATNDTWIHADGIAALMTRLIKETTDIWDPENIFWNVGNNDAAHNLAFADTNDPDVMNCTKAWAQTIIDAKLVNNDLNLEFDELNQVDFYMQTGFFIKQVDPSDKYGLKDKHLYVIALNTNLGASNDRQMDAFEDALKYVDDQDGKVYVFGHHPEIMNGGKIVPKKYRDLVAGTFSGHTHFSSETDENHHTQMGTVSQAGGHKGIEYGDTSYFFTLISEDHPKICMTYERNYFEYKRKIGTADIAQWSRGKKS